MVPICCSTIVMLFYEEMPKVLAESHLKGELNTCMLTQCLHMHVPFTWGQIISIERLHMHSNSLATATAAILVHNENLLRLCTKMAAISMEKGCSINMLEFMIY